MAALAFPDSPVDGQAFVATNGVHYEWREPPGIWVVAEGEEVDTGTGPVVRQTSPELLGNPTAPTPPLADDSTRLATTEFVTAAIAAIP